MQIGWVQRILDADWLGPNGGLAHVEGRGPGGVLRLDRIDCLLYALLE